MRIHKYVEAIVPSQSQNLNGMLNPLFIIYPRSCRLNRFPREDISYGIVAPALQSGEVKVRVLDWEGSGVEVNCISIEKVHRDMRGLIRIAGVLGVSRHIDTPKGNLSAMVIAEVAVLDGESQRHIEELTEF